MVFAVIVFQILMIGIFALKKNALVSSLSIPPVFITIVFYIFMNMYWRPISTYMELEDALTSETKVDEKFLQVQHSDYYINIFIFVLNTMYSMLYF